MPKTPAAYISQLEKEKDELLKQLANYQKEQLAAVKIFKDQEKLISEKDQQLSDKDQLIDQGEEKITNLKTRINQLIKLRQGQVKEKVITENRTTQTEGTNSNELEEQLLAKRWENIQDFGSYREKLTEKKQIISELNKQIKQLTSRSTNYHKRIIILTTLLIIISTLLILK